MKSPSDHLSSMIGTRVKVRLTTGVDFTGKLSCMDGSMNVALQDAAESGAQGKRYEQVLLRGNNVLYIRSF